MHTTTHKLTRRNFLKLAGCATAATAASTALAGCSSGTESDETDETEETTDATTSAEAVETRTVYVSAAWVRSALDGEQEGYEDAIVAEVGYGDVSTCETYAAGHVPGAIYVDICEVEDATGSEEGAYNLLDASEVEAYALAHGITSSTKVILYGADVCGVARQAYGYIWLGVGDVKILNGGIDAWEEAGYETETTSNEGTAADAFGVETPANPDYWTSIEDALERVQSEENFKLVSIRSEEEWLGETSGYTYMDKAGEPEGAVWGKGPETAADVNQFLDDDDLVGDLALLEEVWADCDFTLDNDLAFYCGTGWRACVPFLVLYENGYDNISIFDGGWYEWLFHDDYPVQVGDPASDSCEYTTVGELPTGMASES